MSASQMWMSYCSGRRSNSKKAAVEKIAAGRTPVAVIDMRDYGTMNGKKVLQYALDLIEEKA